jgi:hypothetical protein
MMAPWTMSVTGDRGIRPDNGYSIYGIGYNVTCGVRVAPLHVYT